MDYKYMCIIDAHDIFIDFVVSYIDEASGELFAPNLELEVGKRLLEAPHPGEIVKPHWTGSEWEEYATPKEIEEWNEQQQEEEITWNEAIDLGPTQDQRLTALEQQTTDTQLALAETYEQSERQNTDLMLATAELYESMLALQERVAALEGGAENG